MESGLKNPVFKMILVFISMYAFLTILYGWHVKSCLPNADFFSNLAAKHAAFVLNLNGSSVQLQASPTLAKIYLFSEQKNVISVSESCNGISTLIIFIALILSVAKERKRTLFFLGFGLLSIWAMNTIRIVVLFHIANRHHSWFRFMHETFFPAVVYALAFGIYVLYARKSIQTLKKS